MKPKEVICDTWQQARNAANDFAGVGGRVIGAKEGFVAQRNQFTHVYFVKEEYEKAKTEAEKRKTHARHKTNHMVGME